ncbi:MAG: folate-binding protein, partial [Hyphomicrobiales bacterium]
MATILRPSRAVFRFSGPEAQKLLFDVVTGRIVAEAGPAVWFALLSPQGKIQAEGLAGFHDGAFWLDVDAGVADAFLKRMKMYKLRAQVEIEDLRETHVVGWTDEAEAPGLWHFDPRLGGTRFVVQKGSGIVADETPYLAARIARGVLEQGADYPTDSTFPHDVGMDFLDGVDFKKGCYIGQEVVSRMQHRGTARRRPVIVIGLPDGAAPGAPLLVGEREVGTIGAMHDGRAVAIVRLDRVPDTHAATFAGLPVELHLPDWATYRLG